MTLVLTAEERDYRHAQRIARTLADIEPLMEGSSREVIRIAPEWIASRGLVPQRPGLAVQRAS